MTKEEILRKVIERAVDNGYQPYWQGEDWGVNEFAFILESDYRWVVVIFSHEFARAFWGDGFSSEQQEDKEVGKGQTYIGLRWQYHLQQLVLEEDRIAYLEKFL